MTMHGQRRGPFPWADFWKAMAAFAAIMIAGVTLGIHFGVLR